MVATIAGYSHAAAGGAGSGLCALGQWHGTAPKRPYAAKYYHPHNWRGWWDFGCGALGDMGCHTVNLPFMALKLGHPSSIVAASEELNPGNISRGGRM